MKKLFLSLLVLITIAFTTSVQAQVAPDQARNYQINETHTGSVNSPGLEPPLRQKWSVNFGQNISYPLIADGRVFVTVRNASAQGTNLYALDATSGATLWTAALGGNFWWSALCYENGRVFALNGSDLLRAFDAASGSIVWTRQLGQSSATSAPTVFQGVVYTGGSGSGGTAYAVNAATGAVIWSVPVANGAESSPAVTGDGVYLSYSCPNVYKLNPANGALIWRYSTGCSGGGGKTPALYNGRLYVRDSSPDYIFDSTTGGMAGSFISKHVPVFSGNMGFFLNGPKGFGTFGTLEGRDIDSNMLVWSFAGDGFLQSSMLVVNNYVYVGSDKGKLYAVEASTGHQVWTTTAGTSIPYVDEQNVSQPITGFAAGEGILVIPTKTTLVAYEGDHTPTIVWDPQTPAANASGWNNTPVDVPFTPSAHPAGFTFSTPGSPVHFASEGANQTQQVTVSDQAGNSATFTSPAVKIDLTAPVTNRIVTGTLAGAGVGAWYTSAVQISLTASDSLAGVRSTTYSVDGGATQIYSGPISISNDGTHTVVYGSVDSADNTEAQQTVFVNVDKNAPTTQVSVSGTPNGDGWYHESVQVTLAATDGTSGVANTFYTLDGGATQTYTSPFTVSADGSHAIDYWSVDAVGNAETSHSLTVKIDVSAPSTQLSVSGTAGANGWYVSPNVQISLAPADSLSGVASTYYTVDGGAAQTYAGPFTLDGNAQHQVSFWSVDKVGNTEAQQTSTVKVDNTGPTTQNAVTGPAGNSTYFSGAVQFSLTASDNLSGVANSYYRIDGGPTQTYTVPFTVSGDGTHPVEFWSVDVAGNNPGFATVMIRIDGTAPTTQAAASGTPNPNGWYNAAVQITLTASDSLSGVANSFYAVDGGLAQTYGGPFTVSNTGTHTVLFWSRDQANNAESAQSMIVKIDVTAPSTQAAVSGNSGNGWYQNPATVSLTATDSSSGVDHSYYKIDGGATLTYATPFSVSGAGTHVINYWSVDAVGNTESQQSVTINIDTTAPSTQISASGTTGNNGWYRSSVQVSLTGSDSQAGVANTFYSLDGGPAQTYAVPFYVNEGQHQLSFWSVDRANNSEVHKTAAIKVDLTNPATQSSLSGPGGSGNWFRGTVQMALAATDNLSGVVITYYRIDGGVTKTYTAPFSVSGQGSHSINFWSVDGAGNTAATTTVTLGIDTTTPSTQATATGMTGTNGWYRGPVQVNLNATDNLSGVANRYYNVDGGATLIFTATFTISTAGVHSINFWSMDQAGNTESTRNLSVSIDPSPPVITAAANPSSAPKSVFSLSVTVSGSVTDTPSGVKSGGTTYSVVDEYGVTHPSGSVTVQSNGSYSFKLNLPATRNNGDSDGHLYTITIQSIDKAGNPGAASTTVKIL
jgi:outer membrane protein assembly factor BamB